MAKVDGATDAAEVVITITFDIARCSPNRRMHWRTRAREAKAARAAARWAWRISGEPRAIGPVEVSILIRRGRVMDEDNALASCKSLLDGLLNDGVTPNDSLAWVRHVEVGQETGKGWGQRPEVVFTVRPLAG